MNLSFYDRIRRINLIQELDLSVSVTKSGLALVQMVTSARTRYFQIMLFLSTGLERMMKVLLCLQSLDAKGRFLTERELRALGHDLIELRNQIASRCFNDQSLRRPAIREDLDFIQNDALINEILTVLSDFAMGDRYVYMKGINDPNSNRGWLESQWERIEGMTMPRNDSLRLVKDGHLDEFIDHAVKSIVMCLERFLRALARTVTLSGLSGEARSLGTDVWDFLMLSDRDLGSTKYEI